MEFTLTNLLIACAILWMIRFIYRFFIKPYRMLSELKVLKGATTAFKPFLGEYPQYQTNFATKNDFFYTTKQRFYSNPGTRFYAFPVMDAVHIELYDPELIKEFFNKQYRYFIKDVTLYGVLSKELKTGLAFSDGENWKTQRKILSQIFHFDYMNACIPLINGVTENWIARYCPEKTNTVEVMEGFKMFAAEIVFNVFYGQDSFHTYPNAKKAVKTMLRSMDLMLLLAQSPQNILFGHKYVELGIGKLESEYKAANQFLRDVLGGLTQILKKKYYEKKNEKQNSGDSPLSPTKKPWKNMVELMIEEYEKNNYTEKEIDAQLLKQVITFFVAGIDTTSNNVSMTMWFLAKHPEVQDKLRAELNENLKPGEPVTREHIMKLNYLHKVFRESLRHSCPVGLMFPRKAVEDVMLGDLMVRKGNTVVLSVIGIHQNPSTWSNPDKFDPERWSDKSIEEIVNNPYSAIPFAVGPRKCIGEQLAIIESKTMTIELVRKFKISLKNPGPLKMNFSLTYQPHGELDVVFERL